MDKYNERVRWSIVGDKKLVSVIVPVYNAEHHLESCINNVLNQTYQNLELILVNDGSMDTSGAICEKSAKKDKRVKVIHQSNSGPSIARNAGIEAAEGYYIQFVDSDDGLEPNMLEILINSIEKGAQLVISGYKTINTIKNKKIINEKKPLITGVLSKNKFLECFGELFLNEYLNAPWNKLYIKEIIDENQLNFTPELKMGEDLLFNLTYIDACSEINLIEDTLYLYDVSHTNSLTGNFIKNYYTNQEQLFNKVRIFLKKNEAYNDKNEKFVAIKYSNSIIGCLSNLFHINSNLKYRQVKEAIKEISNDYYLTENLNHSEGNIQKRLIMWLIKYKSVNGIYIFFKIKSFIQFNLQNMFYLFKKLNNNKSY